jgi:ATP-dependent helicase HrpA
MIVRVVDEGGRTLAAGRDLVQLREELGVKPSSLESAVPSSAWHRDGITRWDFGPLPVSIDVRQGGVLLTAYPAVVEQQHSVSLRLLWSSEQAAEQSRAGIRRLFVLADSQDLQEQVSWLPDLKQISLWASGLMTAAEFHADIIALLADRAFLADQPLPRSPEEFQQRLKTGRENVPGIVGEVARLLGPLFKNYHAMRLALEDAPGWSADAAADVRSQLAELLVEHFLVRVPWEWLRHFPRYLEAARIRLSKLGHGGSPRDREAAAEIATRHKAYQERRQDHERNNTQDAELELYRWMLEELRVSLFAQQLGTAIPVSIKRLDKQWEKVE